MSFLQEFKKFAARGNVIDLAVGVIIGGAFNKIVTSIVNDIIMPPLGLVLGKVNFKDLYVNLSGTDYATLDEARKAGAAIIAWGNFVNTIIEFLIIAFVVFLMVRYINKLKREPEEKSPSTKGCPYCTREIPLKATRCPECTAELGSAKPSGKK